MTRQGKLGVIGWFKDFLHGLKLSWQSAWTWQRIYRQETNQYTGWYWENRRCDRILLEVK